MTLIFLLSIQTRKRNIPKSCSILADVFRGFYFSLLQLLAQFFVDILIGIQFTDECYRLFKERQNFLFFFVYIYSFLDRCFFRKAHFCY